MAISKRDLKLLFVFIDFGKGFSQSLTHTVNGTVQCCCLQGIKRSFRLLFLLIARLRRRLIVPETANQVGERS